MATLNKGDNDYNNNNNDHTYIYYTGHLRKVKIQRSQICTFLIYKSDTLNDFPLHNFIFKIVAGIVQKFIKSWNQLL